MCWIADIDADPPPWAQTIAPISPGYWAVSMLQAGMRGDVSGTLLPAAVLTALALGTGTFAWGRLNRGQGRSTVL